MPLIYEAKCDVCGQREPIVGADPLQRRPSWVEHVPVGWIVLWHVIDLGGNMKPPPPPMLCSWSCVGRYARRQDAPQEDADAALLRV